MRKVVCSFLFLTLIGITIVSCSNEEQDLNKTNITVKKVTFSDHFPQGIEHLENIPIKELLNYVYFDGVKSVNFMESNGVDVNSFTDYVKNKLDELNSMNSSNPIKRKPSLEEIRDAMINECQNGYCCGLDDACEIAVKIAYHIKKFEEQS